MEWTVRMQCMIDMFVCVSGCFIYALLHENDGKVIRHLKLSPILLTFLAWLRTGSAQLFGWNRSCSAGRGVLGPLIMLFE